MAFGDKGFKNIKITNVEEIESTDANLYVERAEVALKEGKVDEALYEIDKAISYGKSNEVKYLFEKVRILKASRLKSQCKNLIEINIKKFYKELSLDKFNEVLKIYEFGGNTISDIKSFLKRNQIPVFLAYTYNDTEFKNKDYYIKKAESIAKFYGTREAIEFIDYIIVNENYGNDFEFLKEKANYLLKEGRFKEALVCYKLILERDMYSQEVYILILEACKRYGSLSDEIYYCEKFLKYNSTNEYAIFYKYDILFRQRRYEECIEFLKSLTSNLLNKRELCGKIFAKIAECYDLIGKDIRATYYYLEALSFDGITSLPKYRPTREKIRKRRKITLCISLSLAVLLTTLIGGHRFLYESGIIKPKYVGVFTYSDYETMLIDEVMDLRVSYYIKPKYGVKPEITYISSNPEIADVDKDGKVTAYSEGITEISIIINNKVEDTHEIEVVAPKVEDMRLNYDSICGTIGDYQYVNVDIKMNMDRAEKVKITFESTDESIASVDEDGYIYFNSYGKCTVNVTADNHTVPIEVTVLPQIDDILINGEATNIIEIEEGEELDLVVEIFTTPQIDLDDMVNLEIFNSQIAYIDGDKIIGKSIGVTTLRIEIGEEYKEVTVNVLEKATVTEVRLIQEFKVRVGETIVVKENLKVQYSPQTAKEPKFTFSVKSGYDDYFKVDEYGNLTGLKVGQGILVLQSGDYKGEVRVEVSKALIEDYKVENVRSEYIDNNTYRIKWDIIKDYEYAEYEVHISDVLVDGRYKEYYRLVDELDRNSIDIKIPSEMSSRNIKIIATYGGRKSKVSDEISIYTKEK